jgi:hypothetical protein
MIALTAHEVTPEIMALFELSKPTMPRAFNVLEGAIRGQILVDNPAQPTWAAVRETTFGTLYIGGEFDAPLLATVVAHFRRSGAVGIGCWPDDPLNDILPPNPDYDGVTLYFTERTPQVALSPLMCQIPSGHVLVPCDGQLFTQSFDYRTTLAAFRTVANVLQSTFGIVLLQSDLLLCEAATGAPTHGRIAVGVTTAKTHRQRGFATCTCAALIAMCELQGYTTWWDCAQQNIPSIRLARRLGYQQEQKYRYLWWAQY